MFFISGAVLLAITYVGVAAHTHGAAQVVGVPFARPGTAQAAAPHPARGPAGPGHEAHSPDVTVSVFDPDQRNADLRVLAVVSLIALAIMAAVSMGLGWLIAGRVLRPLRTITTAARDISATDLHRRLALDGPDDEFKELGDTFDGLLARLDASFHSQRQFVANASHELRTPLARLKTLVQVALADPNATLGVAARRPRTRARLRAAAGGTDRGAAQPGQQRAGPRPPRAGRPGGSDRRGACAAAVQRSSIAACS